MKYYDTNGDGLISYSEFVRALIEDLTPRRAKILNKVVNSLDKSGSGSISVSDIVSVFDVSQNPAFIERRKTRDQLLQDFLSNFESVKNGSISRDDFIEYYRDISMNFPADEYFVRMIESTWQVPEDDVDPHLKSTVNLLLKEVRARILELAKNDPKLIRKIHHDFDLNQSGSLTIDEVTNMIAKLKISVERKYIYPFFKQVDADNSGGIEYPEFENYIL